MELWAKIAGVLLTPPGVIVVVALIGFMLQTRWRWFGFFIVGLCIVALLALSLPLTARQLALPLESQHGALSLSVPDKNSPPAEAIVVLGGGRYADAPEYAGDTVSLATLERLRYAARLQQKTDLPVLVSGGAPFGEEVSEAALMRAVLERDFKVKVRWVENKSANTLENARESKVLLQEAGVRRIYLVTHAWHMPRAVWAFTNAGISVTPAPMGFTTLTRAERQVFGYLPSAGALGISSRTLRERLGLLWYRSRHTTAVVQEQLQPTPAR